MIDVMPDNSRRFLLQAIDGEHGCAILEAAFYVDDISELKTLIDADNQQNTEWLGNYEIDPSQVKAVCQRFGIEFDQGDRKVIIERWHSIRSAPYLIHTNYELMLLLDGQKKFARMGQAYPPAQHHNEMYFEPYVAKGILHKEEEIIPFEKPIKTRRGHIFEGIREVYYTIKGEEWRIDAWKLISAASKKSGWNETFERLEGMLFGYNEQQMDWWMTKYRERRAETNQK